jgi:BMFP domain-containing protein YqiC
MTTTQTRFFDELAKMMTNAAGAAQGLRREVDTLVQSQMERILNNMELVKREEFEAVKAMAQKAREENDALSQRIAVLESKLAPPPESASDTRAD